MRSLSTTRLPSFPRTASRFVLPFTWSWKVKADEQSVRDFVEHYTTMTAGQNSDQIVATAYANFLKQPLRTFARNELQKFDAIEVKDNIIAIGKTVDQEVRSLCNGTPFDIIQVVVGNIQYPDSVANAVSMKMSATQDLERVQIEAKKRGSGGRRHFQGHADRTAEIDAAIPAARSHRGAEGDGQQPEPYDHLHSRGADGRALHHATDRGKGMTEREPNYPPPPIRRP